MLYNNNNHRRQVLNKYGELNTQIYFFIFFIRYHLFITIDCKYYNTLQYYLLKIIVIIHYFLII